MQKNHPPSLGIFFATEMWERYGFYVVQTLLALYLALHFHWQDSRVYPLVGSFTALTYISPVLGGWIADRLLGQRIAILAGAFILWLSYLLLSFLHSDLALVATLSSIAVGTGLLKPNISSLLGHEYPEGSSHRESGFTIFYMGINTGILLGTLIPSCLNHLFGWSTAFLSAAFGMIFALAIFSFGIRFYRIRDYYVHNLQIHKALYAFGLISFLWLGSFYILRCPTLANSLFALVVLSAMGYVVASIWQEPPVQARQTMIIGILCLISVFFWAFYFQMFLSLTLFLARVAQPTLGGFPFPPPYYVAIQSIGILAFGVLLARHKKTLSLKERSIRASRKFLFAMLLMTLAYAMIVLICKTHNTDEQLISPFYFIPIYLIISWAELLLSPVGLAVITLLACDKKVSTMMGIFFVSLGVGGYLSGELAILTAIPLKTTSILALKTHYADAFMLLFLIILGATLLCVGLNWAILWASSRLEKDVANDFKQT